MIGLVLAMVATRARQALTLLVLSVFATASAVAAPAFLDTLHRASVLTEAREAAPAELWMRTTLMSVEYPPGVRVLEDIGPTMLNVPGFTRIFYSQVQVLGLGGDEPGALMFREDVCAHLRLLRGRCQMGAPEAMISERASRRLRLDVGDTVTVRYATYQQDLERYVATGAPAELSVVGVYRPADPAERYWAGQALFPERGDDPVFVGRRTMEAVDHQIEYQGYDAVAEPAAVTADTLDAIEAGYERTRTNFEELSGADPSGQVVIQSELPALLARVRANNSAAAQLVPLAAVPLVGLCWFVIFLSVGYAAAGRQEELGLVALRGTGRARRWSLALGEAALPVLAGAPLGYLAGQVLVWASVTAAWEVPVDAGPTARPLPFAAGAVAGALLACVLAHWRALSAPVADLLRGVPSRGARWRGRAGDALVVVCAVVAVVQLRSGGGDLVGVTLLVPALIMLAVAMLGARVVGPGAGALAASALRAGRLGLGLAAVHLARRPGSQRLLALLVVAVAMLGFTSTALDVGGRARSDRARIELGAARALTVAAVDRQQLLAAVRAADPDGAYAMAVVGVPSGGPYEPPALAVDGTRLARVATAHPSFGDGWAALAPRLRPPVADPVVLRGRGLTATATVTDLSEGGVDLWARLRPVDGGSAVNLKLGALVPGRRAYTAGTPRCVRGCRLAGLYVKPPTETGYRVALVLHEVRQAGSATVLAGPAELADPQRWRGVGWRVGAGGPRLAPAPDGVLVTARGDVGSPSEIVPGDVPAALPVLSTAALPRDRHLRGLDGRDVEVALAASVPALPGLGEHGMLMDLEYGERAAADTGGATRPQVWLSAAAPPDAADRLTAVGLKIIEDRSRVDVRERLDRQGSAVALRFHLVAAALAVLLGAGAVWLVALVDRGRRGRELWALRLQGVPARAVARASLWGYLGIVFAALLIGPIGAAAAWWAVGGRLPIFVDGSVIVAPPGWPRPGPVALAWLVAAVLLTAVSALAGRAVRRAADEGGGP